MFMFIMLHSIFDRLFVVHILLHVAIIGSRYVLIGSCNMFLVFTPRDSLIYALSAYFGDCRRLFLLFRFRHVAFG